MKTSAQISRDTLFWRDAVRSARVRHAEASDAWRVVAVRGCASNDERRILKGLKYDMDQAQKGLQAALKSFTEAAFADLESVK